MRTTHPARRLPRPLLLFEALMLLLALCSGVDAAVGYRRFGAPGLSYFWLSYPAFDFVDYTLQFPYLHTAKFFTLPVFPWVYPAPAILVLYPFFKIVMATNRVVGFAVFAFTALAANLALAGRFGQALVQRGLSRSQAVALIATILVLGWPLYFSLQRGNLESLLWVGIAVGVCCFARGRFLAAAVLFGLIGSVKLYPLLFLALLLRPRRFGDIGVGVLAAVTATLVGLRVLNPDIGYAWERITTGIRYWTTLTTSTYPATGLAVDHSALGLLRQCTHGAILSHPQALNWYLATVALIASCLFFGRVLFLPRPNQVLYLACCTVLLPPTSFDYTLVVMLIPCGWVVLLCVEAAGAGRDLQPFFPLLTLFALALGVLSFLHAHTGTPVYVEGPVRAVALLALLVWAVLVPMPEGDPVSMSTQAMALRASRS